MLLCQRCIVRFGRAFRCAYDIADGCAHVIFDELDTLGDVVFHLHQLLFDQHRPNELENACILLKQLQFLPGRRFCQSDTTVWQARNRDVETIILVWQGPSDFILAP